MTIRSLRSLPGGTRLSQYELVSVLGSGGFGITYLGRDTVLDKPVAIKEYMPSDLAVRMGDSTVVPESEASRADFTWGLERFLDEARVLGRFRHENVVGVLNFMHQNGTAYIVMEHVSGETLTEVLKRKARLGEAELRGLVEGLLSGLEAVHAADYLHRDIKPGNVILRSDGTPVLLDFGSARQSVTAKSRSVTAIVTPGYAPIEQYSSRGNQGPWTDIYAVGAICYRAMTGEVPVDATERVRRDPLVPASEHPVSKGTYSPALLAAVDEALKVDEDARPQSVAAWRAFLSSEQAPTEKRSPARPADPAPFPAQKDAAQKGRRALAAAGIFAVVLGASGVALMISGQGTQPDAAPDPAAVTAPEFPSVAGLDDAVAAPSLAQEETAPAPTVLAHRAYLEDAANRRFRAEAEAAVSRHEAAVLRLQTALSAKGFAPGNVDGRADLATVRAIEAFRAAAGYSAPGVDLSAIDAAPIAALAAAVESWTRPQAVPPALTEPAPQPSLPETATTRRVGDVFRDGFTSGSGQGPEMVVLPSGSFMMGSPLGETGRDSDEGPRRTVRIGYEFAVGKYEVTWSQYSMCVSAGACREAKDDGFGQGNRPVTNVSWHDARKYASWLSGQTGQTYRLLTEAQWEYAARAGTSRAYWWGTSASHEYANYGADKCCSGLASGRDQWDNTSPAGSFPANAFGLHNMHGNVWEWVEDCYEGAYSVQPSDGSAFTKSSCSTRVVRGGSWLGTPRHLRSAGRRSLTPGLAYVDLGFRLARTLP